MSKKQKKKIVLKETTKLKRRIIQSVLSNSKNNHIAFNLDLLVDGWLELESDPGTFSLLIEDFGCFGAQVDEVYDLDQKFDGPVFGFIFLFKWLNTEQNERSRNRDLTSNTTNHSFDSKDNNGQSSMNNSRQWSYVEDENILNQIFFAKQMISNSCATHALISVLLNCDYDELNLGPTLTKLKEHTKIMNPENKGYAIGNVPELAKAHNSHASYSSLYSRNRPSSQSRGMSFVIRGNQRTNLQQQNQLDTYHFVSYVPINNRLYELDGLKNYPIDHGPLDPNEDWTEKFKKVIKQRLLDNTSDGDSSLANDIRYNLMAVVPDKRICLKTRVRKLKCYLKSVQDSMRELNTKQTSMETHDVAINPQNSPTSNGTLTASERGSVCDSPRHSYEDNSYQADVEIPRPPYSPLSVATLTASERGSVCNSPTNLEDSYFYDDKCKVEKYYFVKFDQQAAQSPKTTTTATEVSKGTTPTSPKSGMTKDEKSHALENFRRVSQKLSNEIERLESELKEEVDRRHKYKLDNSRRTHNYEPFIVTFLSLLAKQGNLADLIERNLGLNKQIEATTANDTTNTSSSTLKASPPPTQPRQQQTQQQPQQNNHPVEKRKVGRPRKYPLPCPVVQIAPPPPPPPTPPPKPKPKYKYVSTGRPRGRPRKYPLLPPPPPPPSIENT